MSTKANTIRRATEADIPRLVEMGLNFLRDGHYSQHLTENPDRMAQLVRQLLDSAGGVLVSEHGGRLTGMLGYVVHDHFISGERVAGEVFWWVDPDARGDGLRLLRAAESSARFAGARSMQMIAPDERTGNLYQRLGYFFVEQTYQRAL